MRALRPDKLTLTALAAPLPLDRANQLADIPTTRMLGATRDALRATADRLAAAIGTIAGLAVAVEPCTSTVGGGAMPTAELASWAVTLAGKPADELDRALRRAATPVIGKIEDGRMWLDVRTIADDELDDTAAAVRRI
jgi:L-seryl-tRNA(Ser) seleniumtransferase